MTDNLESLPTGENDPTDRHPTGAQVEQSQQQEEQITLDLPVDVIVAINQRLRQAGQTQSEVILEVLRSALAVDPDRSAVRKPVDRDSGQTHFPTIEATFQPIQELQALKLRLRQLEQLIPKVEELEGKLQAF